MRYAIDQITRTWTNPYNSKMTLHSARNGVLWGLYSSTAGSSGVYRVDGYIAPRAVAVTEHAHGVPVALILNWRSIARDGKPDASWNYVSGMAGQLIMPSEKRPYRDDRHADERTNPVIHLNHALIASNPFPKVIGEKGFYVDRLEYEEYTPPAKDALNDGMVVDPPEPLELPSEDLPDQDHVLYVDEQNPSTRLRMVARLDRPRFFAQFQAEGVATTLIGTCNVGFNAAGVWPFQSIAFCGTGLTRSALSLSGWLDHSTDTLTLQMYQTESQPWASRYFETRGRTIVMRRR